MVIVTSRLQVIPTNTSTKSCFCVKPGNSDFSSVQQGCETVWVWQSSCPKTQHPVIASGFDVLFLTINEVGRKLPTQVGMTGQGRLVGHRWEDPSATNVCTHSWCSWCAAVNTNTRGKGQCRALCSLALVPMLPAQRRCVPQLGACQMWPEYVSKSPLHFCKRLLVQGSTNIWYEVKKS